MSNVNKHTLSLLQTGYTTIDVVFSADNNRTNFELPSAVQRAEEIPPWAEAIPYQPGDRVFGPNGQPSTVRQPMPPKPAVTETPRYTFKVKLEDDVKPGMSVVVDTNFGFKVAYVLDVHASPRIDTMQPFEYKWIVQIVDEAKYRQRLLDEQNFNDTLQAVERERLREQTLQSMSAHLPEGSNARAMFNDALARLGAVQAIAAPVPTPTPAVPQQQPAPSSEGMQCR